MTHDQILMIIVVSCTALVALLGTTWRLWWPKRCPVCGYANPARTKKCVHCHEWFPLHMRLASLLLLSGGFLLPDQAAAFQLLDCPTVHFFDNPCEEAQGEAPRPPAPPAPPQRPEYPLFPRETLAPDTPPLMVNVFNDPSDANIDAYLAWHERKVDRMKFVQDRLQQRALLRLQSLPGGTK